MRLSPSASGPFAVALALFVSAPLGAQTQRALPTEARTFAELPGQQEFRGVLVARPLQVADADSFGLATAEVVERARLANALLGGFELERYEGRTDESFIKVPAGSSEQEVADDLMASGAFQYVEPDWRVWPVACPNDSNFGQQWHHAANLMNSCAGWDIATGDPNTVVAICDTGLLTTHEDIQLHRREGYNAVDQVWENSGGNIGPVHPHGTMTTGCAAANGNNGVGISGVGWNLGHRMMRVSNDSSGNSSIGVLTHAAMTAADAGDRVASVSYSGVTSASVDTAGAYCRARGTLLVWAAGNDGANLGGSRDDNVIVVGATDSGDNLAGFSAFGSLVDLVAPGVSVHTMDSGSNSDYANVSGTSFSTPLTAGLCALLFSHNPALTPQEVEDYVRQGCDDLGAAGVDNTFGYGRIDVGATLLLANPVLQIGFPSGRPDLVTPSGGTPLEVTVAAGTSVPVSNSGRLHVDSGSGFQTIPMTETSPGAYDVTFPTVPCGSQVDWYVDFDLAGGGTFSSPETAPADSYSALAWIVNAVADDDLEVSVGWVGGVAGDTATTGVWEWGDPNGTIAQPEDDHTVAGVNCWFTGQGTPGGSTGENDVDNGYTTLVSPSYDLTGLNNPVISYWRWYSNDLNGVADDVFVVDISNNGGASWTNIETLASSSSWTQFSFEVSSFVTPTSTVQLRFIAADVGTGSFVEAAIDDLAIEDLACTGCAPPSNYCQTAPNSVGAGATISSFGSTSVVANDLVLMATGLPATQPGVFYYGDAQAQLAFGNGFRCAGGSSVRLGVLLVDGFGDATQALDLTNLPGGNVIQAGDTRYFQFWYRDPAGGGSAFNLTDGLSVTFCP